MRARIIRQVATINSFVLNTAGLNTLCVPTSKKRPAGYGVDNWQWDDGTTMLWDNKGVVLTDK